MDFFISAVKIEEIKLLFYIQQTNLMFSKLNPLCKVTKI